MPRLLWNDGESANNRFQAVGWGRTLKRSVPAARCAAGIARAAALVVPAQARRNNRLHFMAPGSRKRAPAPEVNRAIGT